MGIELSRSRLQWDFEIFLHLSQFKLSSPIGLSQLWHIIRACDVGTCSKVYRSGGYFSQLSNNVGRSNLIFSDFRKCR